MGTQDNKKKRRNGSNASNAIAARKVMFIVLFIFICILMPMMNHMNIDNSFLTSYVDQISSPFYYAADNGDGRRENGMDRDSNAHNNDDGDVTEDIQRDIDNDGTEKVVVVHDNKNDSGNKSVSDGDGGKERSTINDNNTTKAVTDTDANDKANIITIINDGDKEEKVAADVKSNGNYIEEGRKADETDNEKEITKEEDENEGKGDKTQDEEEAKKGPKYKPLAPHPHAGARYPDGRFGYVPDLTAVRKQHFQQLEDWRNNNDIHIHKINVAIDDDDANGNAANMEFEQEEDQNGETFASHRMKNTLEISVFEESCNGVIGKGFEREGIKLIKKVQVGGPPPVNENVTVTLDLSATASNSININISNSTSTDNSTSMRRLRASDTSENAKDDEQNQEQKQVKSRPRLLCAVYTYEPNHATNLQAVVNTWAWKCDGFFAASSLTNETLGAVDLPHQGKEEYGNMWQKTRSIWGYINDNFVEDYDYFWLGGDDVSLIVENLRGVIDDHSIEGNPEDANEKNIPVFLGQNIPIAMDGWFCAGGPGYVLNRVAVKRLAAEALPTCASGEVIAAEDRYLSRCMRKIGIMCGNAVDANKRQRFANMDPHFLVVHPGHRAFYKMVYEFWGRQNDGFKWGLDLHSEQLVGYHNLRYPHHSHRIHALQYPGTCPSNSTVGQTLHNALMHN
uniref:Uncharacterized protein n=2 Tax=Chaetoceros debilis TaxID=122233 RepID=A0A7S3Q616_9STRA